MRNPPNDTPSLKADRDDRSGDQPERRCILTGEHGPRSGLVRLAIAPDGQVAPDVRARAPGRGAWIGVDRGALDTAIGKGKLKGALARAFKGTVAVPDDLAARTEDALRKAALDRLGLEARAGTLLTGTERIETAARGGTLHALYHAADAGSDGSRRLAQAWRVGSEREGSGLAGVTLPLDRTILSQALGRENAVHIGLIDYGAAQRVEAMLSRWLHFIGSAPTPSPCATIAQGSSASASPLPATDVQGQQTRT